MPTLEPETEDEKRRFVAAQVRRELRREIEQRQRAAQNSAVAG